MKFPDESYQWEEMKDDFIFIGAYINDEYRTTDFTAAIAQIHVCP